MARPSSYSPEIAAEVIRRLLESETLTAICQDDHMPSRATIYQWQTQQPAFADAFAHARIAQADLFVDESRHIADTELDPQRARVRVDTRLKLAQLVNPKRYGQKLDITVSERPSLKDALHEAHARIGRPVDDQHDKPALQVIDPLVSFLAGASDSQSLDPEPDPADLLAMDENDTPGGLPGGTPKNGDRTSTQGAPDASAVENSAEKPHKK